MPDFAVFRFGGGDCGAAAAIIIVTASRDNPVRRAISSALAPAPRTARAVTFDTGVETLIVRFDPDRRFGRATTACSAGMDCIPIGVSHRVERHAEQIDAIQKEAA